MQPTKDEAAVGQAGLLGGIAGFALVASVVAGGALAGGMEAASAVALGVFVGSFGGVGFGFMVGASLALGREMAASAEARRAGATSTPAAPVIDEEGGEAPCYAHLLDDDGEPAAHHGASQR